MNPAAQDAMTALIRNGGYGGGEMLGYATRNSSLNWWEQFGTESGALPLVPVGARGSRRRIEESNLNLVINPTGGVNATGWTSPPGGTNDTSRVVLSAEGVTTAGLPDGVTTGFKCTFNGGSIKLAEFPITLTAAAHEFSYYLFIPSAWDGTGDIRMSDAGLFAGATGTQLVNANTALTDQWQRLNTDFTIDVGDIIGGITVLHVNNDATAGKVVYIAAVQIEESSYPTSYTDGSLGTGYTWSGTAHASKGIRAASRLTASAAVLDETTFAFPMWFTPEFANTDRTSGVLRLLDWADDANNFITVEYDLSSNTFECARKGGTTLATASVARTFAAGDHIFIVPAGDAANVYISVNGAVLTAQAQTDIPTLSATVFDIGADAGAASHCNSIVGPATARRSVPTHAEIVELYAKGPAAMNMGGILA